MAPHLLLAGLLRSRIEATLSRRRGIHHQRKIRQNQGEIRVLLRLLMEPDGHHPSRLLPRHDVRSLRRRRVFRGRRI